MNATTTQNAIAEGLQCAAVILESACFIQNELPSTHLSDPLRSQVERVCADLVSTKHDIVSDLHELQSELRAASSEEEATTSAIATFERLISWIQHDLRKIHGLVTALDTAQQQRPELRSAWMLIIGCATNMLQACNRFMAAVDSTRRP